LDGLHGAGSLPEGLGDLVDRQVRQHPQHEDVALVGYRVFDDNDRFVGSIGVRNVLRAILRRGG